MSEKDSPLYRLPPVEDRSRRQAPAPPFPAMANSTMGGITAPNLPPTRFKDDALMHVIVKVRNENDRAKRLSQSKFSYKLKSFKSRVLGRGKYVSCSDVRVVRMPRKEYLKHFARDRNNQYIGTEAERIWTDEELELKFGKYGGSERPKWVVGRNEGRVYMVEDDKDVQWKRVMRGEKL